ncbi:MAG TPA: hypothetical protein DDZ68_00880 [Parvularcula sp.]|nr:hypothetical protein [Parvularcula sp.]HBS31323.1 hypothetical protein [Parvularcula sp.]HBS34160.1 hypothetical protein [Parvularcula sp.]
MDMMKPILAATLFVSAAAPAIANDTAESCKSYVEKNGGDASGCDCLGEAAANDPDLAAALAEIETPEDLGAADEATKAAIAACFPNA